MRFFIFLFLIPATSFSMDFSETDIEGKLKKLLSLYPHSKTEIKNSHISWLNSAKSDCALFASIKHNNLARSQNYDCMLESKSNRANFYEQLIINKN